MLLNPTLECIDKYRLRQLSIPSAVHVRCQQKKQHTNKKTNKPEQRVKYNQS